MPKYVRRIGGVLDGSGMHIGVIVYSHTGHTWAVANQLSERLRSLGHECALERIVTDSPMDPGVNVVRSSAPLVGAKYDCVVLCCPVRGGLPAPPMETYVSHIGSLAGTKVACLVTGFFPVASWGRDQSLARLREVCESKGATVCGSSSVGWFSMQRRKRIAQAVDTIVGCLAP